MGSYLETFLQSIESLPAELHQKFTLMRELDEKAQALLEECEKNAEIFFQGKCKDAQLLQKIRADHQRSLDLSDEKVQLATQAYDFVDKYIQKLDENLGKFHSDLQVERGRGSGALSASLPSSTGPSPSPLSRLLQQPSTASMRGPSPPASATPIAAPSSHYGAVPPSDRGSWAAERGGSGASGVIGVKQPAGAVTRAGMKGPGRPPIQRGAGGGQRGLPFPLPASLSGDNTSSFFGEADMPIDPNEPLYCVCHQPSFGEMVACDGPDCEKEWFHFACVGLDGAPKGKWYCPDCRNKMAL